MTTDRKKSERVGSQGEIFSFYPLVMSKNAAFDIHPPWFAVSHYKYTLLRGLQKIYNATNKNSKKYGFYTLLTFH